MCGYAKLPFSEIVIPSSEMSVMAKISLSRAEKEVDTMMISSPMSQSTLVSTVMLLSPTAAGEASLVHVTL